MIPVEIIGLTVLGSSAIYLPFYLWMRQNERTLWRKLLAEKQLIIEMKETVLREERRLLFNSLQDKASANATVPCRTCMTCKRVVHRYRPIADGVICKECDVESKGMR